MSKKVNVPLWKKILWRGIVFPVLALGILGLGAAVYMGGGAGTETGAKSATAQNVLVIDSAAKAKSVMGKVQEAEKAGKPVFMEICDGEFCAEQLAALDKVAGDYKDKMVFVAVKPSMIAPLLPTIMQFVDGPMAFPLHFIETGGKTPPIAMTGMLPPEQLKILIETALKIHSGELKLPAPTESPATPTDKSAVPSKKDSESAPNGVTTTQPSGK